MADHVDVLLLPDTVGLLLGVGFVLLELLSLQNSFQIGNAYEAVVVMDDETVETVPEPGIPCSNPLGDRSRPSRQANDAVDTSRRGRRIRPHHHLPRPTQVRYRSFGIDLTALTVDGIARWTDRDQ